MKRFVIETFRHRLALVLTVILASGFLPVVGTACAATKKVLVVTVTKGFRHSSIPTAMHVLGELAEKSKGAFMVDYAFTDEDLAEKMAPEKLKTYDGFIFANTTGVLPLPDKAAFLEAIKGGKGFVGMHSASDTFHGPNNTVDPYTEMLGGEFETHHAQAGVECLVEDRAHPATKPLGEAYCIEQEEIYLIKSYDPTKVRELLVLDKHPNNKKQAGRFPVAWCKAYGEGKVFYTSLGHREDVWMNERYQKHILGGIRWSLGLEPGSAVPQSK